jgi:hypothetical protein
MLAKKRRKETLSNRTATTSATPTPEPRKKIVAFLNSLCSETPKNAIKKSTEKKVKQLLLFWSCGKCTSLSSFFSLCHAPPLAKVNAEHRGSWWWWKWQIPNRQVRQGLHPAWLGAKGRRRKKTKKRGYLPTYLFLRFFEIFRSDFRKHFYGVFGLLM